MSSAVALCMTMLAANAQAQNLRTTVNGAPIEMIEVKGGTFMMGDQTRQNKDALPLHRVTLSSYYVGRTEVTQKLWTAVMGYNDSNFKGDYRPVENIDYEEIQTFLKKLNKATGINFRLLTEAMEDGRYGILSPVQLDGSGKKMDRQFAKRCKSYLRKQKDEKIVEVPFVMASHWMISRGCLQKVGGFSPAFIMYGEDDNYIDRARWNGYLCGVVPAASAVHDRADRPSNKDQRMFLKCNASIVHVSNPAGWELLRLIGEPLRLAAIGCIHFDGTPFKFIGAFLIPEKKKK